MSSGALNLTAGPQLIADWSTPVLRRSTFPMGQRQAHPTNPIPIAVSLTSVLSPARGTGQAFVPHDVVGRISKAASVPVYGFIDQYVGRGLVGGDVYSFAAHGAQAAMLALQVLGGNTSSSMVVTGRSMVLFDWRQLQRWKISESRLPPGSEILFREPTVWDTYRWQIVTIATVILAQAALILWLLWEHRRRRTLEVEG